MVQLALGFLNQGTDLLQTLQIPHGTGEEDAEHEVNAVGESQPTLLLIAYKVYHHIRLVVADGDAHPLVQDNAQRDGGMWRAALRLLDVWDTEDDERPAFVVIVAGTLVLVSDVINEIVGDFQVVNQKFLIVAAGASYLHPAIGLPLIERPQPLVVVPECTHAVSSF